ncbi:hypothetical protein H4R35_004301 [Dimargaris xerosporica]|nr:hypothetical protein H4R35_004301 [Dimargaris xerosporica]
MTHPNIVSVDPEALSFDPAVGVERDHVRWHGQAVSLPARPLDPTAGPTPGVAAPAWLTQAQALLNSDQVVALPTETVYGLAGHALAPRAVTRIFEAKNRPMDNPLIVHVSSLAMLRALLPDGQLPTVYEPLIRQFWPGPLTILVPASPLIPPEVSCGQPTVAIRFPAHPVARAVIAYSGLPLAAPSANSSGKPSPTLASHVWDDLQARVPLILDAGQCHWGIESTVVDGLRNPPAILRPGGVTLEQIQTVPGFHDCQVYRKNFTDPALELAPTTPGMKYRHYSPAAQVILLQRSCVSPQTPRDPDAAFTEAVLKLLPELSLAAPAKVGVLRLYPGAPPLPRPQLPLHLEIYYRAMADDTFSDASMESTSPRSKHLFRSFREFDQLGVQYILVEGASDLGEGLALMNRLHKAASRVVLY